MASTDPVRVLWFINGLGFGGAERLLEFLLAHTDRDRFHVEIAYARSSDALLVPAMRAQGVRLHSLGAAGALDLSWVPRLRRIVRRGQFQIVHAHSPFTASLARLAMPRRPPFVYTEHSSWELLKAGTRVLNAATYPRNDAVIAVSQAAAASIRRPSWMPSRAFPPVEVVHHGFDDLQVRRGPQARAAARQALGLGEQNLVIGCLANLRPEKNHALLLDCFARLAPGRPRLRLVLVGDGPVRGALQARASSLGIADRVQFTGLRSDARALLPAFDVFTLPSDIEGLPIALLEAMATGLPVVATAVGGVPEVMTDGKEGFLVPPGDPEAMTAALHRMLEGEQRADMGRLALQSAENFSISQAAQRMQEIYERVLLARG